MAERTTSIDVHAFLNQERHNLNVIILGSDPEAVFSA
jgi:hypothetical protein